MSQNNTLSAKEICHSIIIELIKNIDDYMNNDNIEKETINMLSSFNINELIDLKKTLESDDEKYDNILPTLDYKNLNWFNISSAISHELSDKISSVIIGIIKNFEKNNIKSNDLSPKTVKHLLNILSKKRKLGQEEIKYIKNLIERSKQFTKCMSINI